MGTDDLFILLSKSLSGTKWLNYINYIRTKKAVTTVFQSIFVI